MYDLKDELLSLEGVGEELADSVVGEGLVAVSVYHFRAYNINYSLKIISEISINAFKNRGGRLVRSGVGSSYFVKFYAKMEVWKYK